MRKVFRTSRIFWQGWHLSCQLTVQSEWFQHLDVLSETLENCVMYFLKIVPSNLVLEYCISFLTAAVTNYHIEGVFKQQKLVSSQFRSQSTHICKIKVLLTRMSWSSDGKWVFLCLSIASAGSQTLKLSLWCTPSFQWVCLHLCFPNSIFLCWKNIHGSSGSVLKFISKLSLLFVWSHWM